MMEVVTGVHHNAVITHGTVMGFAFAFLFPLGAILIRVASFRGLIWVHAAIQSLAYALALAGLGLGIYIAIYPESQVCQLFHGRRANEAYKFSRSPETVRGIPLLVSSWSAAFTCNPFSRFSITRSTKRLSSARFGASPMSGGVASSSRLALSTEAWVYSSAEIRPKAR